MSDLVKLSAKLPGNTEDGNDSNGLEADPAIPAVPQARVASDRTCKCGCRYGTNDPDVRDCACDGPCCMAPDEEWYGYGTCGERVRMVTR